MKVYLVRMIEDQMAVGIFWVKNPPELFSLIDEKHDPGAFECLPITDPGGLFFDDGFAEWKLGVKENHPAWENDEGASVEQRLKTVSRCVTFSEELSQNLLVGYDEIGGWVPLPKLVAGRIA